ncbi:MAG TPA: tripartite tricarboxylate transporter substrate binding protein [Burkholderiales bacterium]|nr:tripartite tricarboxylate transporter substrate binding protein [Burkholderiales bacterium]
MGRNCRSSIRFGLLTAALLAAGALPVHAAERYPSRPIRVIVPFPPGGSTDFNARAIQDKLTEQLGQQIVIDNRGGASGQIGTKLVKDSTPDGYTLLVHTIAFVTSPILYDNAGYDPVKDFMPVTMISQVPTTVSVHPSVPVHSVKELLALARSKPDQLIYASSGIGTNSHITGELFNLMGNTSIRAIQYKGGGPALAAVVSGEVQIGFSNITQTARMAEAGRVRMLAVSSLKRSPSAPNLPTVAESGLPGFEMAAWHIIAAPRDTPAAIIKTLNEKVRAALKDPVVAQRYDKGGMEHFSDTPQETIAHLRSEQAKWSRVIRERKMKGE